MEIHYNEEFDSFEVTKCDCKFGKSIILDGEPMIPAAALEAYKTVIKQKVNNLKFINTDDVSYGVSNNDFESEYFNDSFVLQREVLNVIDNTNVNEKCKTDPVSVLRGQGMSDCYSTLKDIYICSNIEDFMIETFGYLMDVSEMIFTADDPEKLMTQFKEWQEKEKNIDLER